MLKTISAALLAVSVIAAPALAAEQGKTATPAPAPAPVAKAATPAPESKTAPVIKSEQAPSKAMNANAKMTHKKHYRHRRTHKQQMGVLKTKHVTPKVAIKHVAPAKRG
ncbi:His-rich protein BRANT [Bradyrhizobium erythrophlei]|uniref:His-rich protein BRANT n=1 Tax=Bradyrhizobium erythrophlei TaxID=1437360 RepID=UPI0035E559DC